jgi:hypothetical protein
MLRTIGRAVLVASIGALITLSAYGGIGAYSRSAVMVWANNHRLVVPSPDRQSSIVVQPFEDPAAHDGNRVTVHTHGREYKTDIGDWVNAEVEWSPDSKAFFVTYSDGGNVGTYHVKIFFLGDSGLRVLEPIPDGRVLFAPTCYHEEWPNVGAIKWIGSDPSVLLIAVEVPPHSSCASMGNFRAFQIDVNTGKVISQYDQISAKKLFMGDIGEELRAADDSCVRHPLTCVPPGLESPSTGTKNDDRLVLSPD